MKLPKIKGINKKVFGARIRAERQKKNMTIAKLAELVEISPNYLGQIERGHDVPSLAITYSIAQILGVGVDSFLFDKSSVLYNDIVLNDIIRHLSDYDAKQREFILDLLKSYEEKGMK